MNYPTFLFNKGCKLGSSFAFLMLIIEGIFTPALASDLLLVGGGWEYPATGDPYGISMYDKIVQQAGNGDPTQAVIRIFTTASSSEASATSNGGLWVQDFVDLYHQKYTGITPNVEWIPFHIDNCSDLKNQSNSQVISAINSANAIVFGGGDQSLITECFFNEDPVSQTRTTTPVFDALISQFNNNDIIIAGTSAGTAVQTSEPMITEGESYEALINDPIALIGSPPIVRELYYNPLGGLGLFTEGILDTHFSERGRQGRLIRLAEETNTSMAFGIDENTGLLVTNVGQSNASMEVLGENGVTLFDLSNATRQDQNGYFGINHVSVSYLTEGDRYDPHTKTATFPNKNSLSCDPLLSALTTEDIFSYRSTAGESGNRDNPREFVNVATSLFESCQNSTQGTTFEQNPAFEVTMTEETTMGSQGYQGTDSLGNLKTSFINLNLDIQVTETPASVPEGNLTWGLLGIGTLFLSKRQWRR